MPCITCVSPHSSRSPIHAPAPEHEHHQCDLPEATEHASAAPRPRSARIRPMWRRCLARGIGGARVRVMCPGGGQCVWHEGTVERRPAVRCVASAIVTWRAAPRAGPRTVSLRGGRCETLQGAAQPQCGRGSPVRTILFDSCWRLNDGARPMDSCATSRTYRSWYAIINIYVYHFAFTTAGHTATTVWPHSDAAARASPHRACARPPPRTRAARRRPPCAAL